MRLLVTVITIFSLSLLTTHKAHAIIFLPAIILIPIAKIIALIIGALSIPAIGVGTLSSKLFKKSIKQTLFAMLIILLLMGIILGVFLKLQNPNRPLF